MNGFYIGDIIGNAYAHENEEYNFKSTDFELFCARSKYSDDTILTVATMECLMSNNISTENMIKILKKYYELYPDQDPTMYGSGYVKWITSVDPRPRSSGANGGPMRVSPIGWYAESIEEIKALVKSLISATHNTDKALQASEIVAVTIYLLRIGKDKDYVINYLNKEYAFVLPSNYEKYRQDYTFTCDAVETIVPALLAFMYSDNFEDCLRRAVSFGGDTDTITSIAGAIAEARYEVPQAILLKARPYLPRQLTDVIDRFDRLIKERNL